MTFGKFTQEDLKKSAKCPPGMHLATLTEVKDSYTKDNQVTVQEVSFETDKGYIVRNWFNSGVISQIAEFICAADNVQMESLVDKDLPDLKEYVGKKVAISVSHNKDKQGKIQSNIDNFFSAAKIPF